MPASSTASVLITGANSGIGKEVARQLAESDSFDTIYLGCRNQAKADAARAELERTTGKSIFTTVPLDTSDLGSVRAAIDLIDTPLRAVVMNAGGTGGSTPLALTADGVTEIFASNVLGHAALLEQLIAADALTGSAVLVGSEAARGVPKLRLSRPTFAEHSVDEFTSVIDGSFFAGGKVDTGVAYGQVKYLGALWMSELARRNPHLRARERAVLCERRQHTDRTANRPSDHHGRLRRSGCSKARLRRGPPVHPCSLGGGIGSSELPTGIDSQLFGAGRPAKRSLIQSMACISQMPTLEVWLSRLYCS